MSEEKEIREERRRVPGGAHAAPPANKKKRPAPAEEPAPRRKRSAEPEKDAPKPAKKRAAEPEKDAPKPVKKRTAEPEKDAPKPAEKRAAEPEKDAPKPAAAPEAPEPKKAAPAPKKAETPAEAPKSAAPAEGQEPLDDIAEAAPVKKKKSGKKALRRGLLTFVILVSLVLLLCAGTTLAGYLVTKSETNLPNVYLGDVYVGGLTKEQTVEKLREERWEQRTGGKLRVEIPEGIRFDVDYLEAEASLSCEQAAELAFSYGHGEDWFVNLLTYVGDVFVKKDLSDVDFQINEEYVAALVDRAVDKFETVTSHADYRIDNASSTLQMTKGAGQATIDRAALRESIRSSLLNGEHRLEWTEISGDIVPPDFDAIAAELNKDVADAYYDPEKDIVVPEVMGVAFDTATATEAWNAAGVLERVDIPIVLVEPEVTAEELRALLFRDCLGSTTTYMYGSTQIRIGNIRLACSMLDGLVIMPGETFSYNGTIGERTPEAGFGYAPAYSGDEVVYEVGGGICQVSSTLYNSVLGANLQVDERSCHNFAVTYLPKGLDATVSWPTPDFKFTNNREYPIRISAGTDRLALTIEIYGTNVDGTYVEPMGAWWPTYESEKYPEVQTGWGARSYRYIYDADGNLIDKQPEEYSYYHLHPEEINWPAEPEEEDEEGGEGGSDGGEGGGESGGEDSGTVTVG